MTAALNTPLLCLVTDPRLCPDGSLATRVRAAVAGGVGMVQVREKDLPTEALTALATELRAACGGRALLLVNGDPVAAREAGADGVHLPEDGPGVADARRLAGRDMLVGRSVHSAIAAMRAEVEGVDYLIGGTVFETRSHPGKQPEGLRVLTQVASAVKVPVLGIGGITTENAPSVMKAGAAGVAVTSAILAAADTEGAAAALAAAISVGRVVLTVNGHPETLPGPTRLTEYLAARLDPRRMVAIGHNGEVVHRQDWGNVVLKEGDSLDIVHMVGGGC